MSETDTILTKIKQFRDERDWRQFHDPKNMAVSIAIEAAELLQEFQWKTPAEVERHVRDHKEQVQDEIADIALYLFELADNLDINLFAAMDHKLQKNAAYKIVPVTVILHGYSKPKMPVIY